VEAVELSVALPGPELSQLAMIVLMSYTGGVDVPVTWIYELLL